MSLSTLARSAADVDPDGARSLGADEAVRRELHAGVLLIVCHKMISGVIYGIPPCNVTPGVRVVLNLVETGLSTPGASPIGAFNGGIACPLRLVPLAIAFSLLSRTRGESARVPELPLLKDQLRRSLTLQLAGGNVAPKSTFRGVLIGATGASDRGSDSAPGQELRPRASVNRRIDDPRGNSRSGSSARCGRARGRIIAGLCVAPPSLVSKTRRILDGRRSPHATLARAGEAGAARRVATGLVRRPTAPLCLRRLRGGRHARTRLVPSQLFQEERRCPREQLESSKGRWLARGRARRWACRPWYARPVGMPNPPAGPIGRRT